MNNLRNEKGIALVTSLMLTLLTLVIAMTLMYFIEIGTQMSASVKRYKNVREAAYGGVSITVNEVIPSLENAIFNNYSSGEGSGIQLLKADYASIKLDTPNIDCLKRKLITSTSSWNDACNSTLDAKTSPDLTFVLKSTLAGFNQSNQGYSVYAKIVDTPIIGNTDKTVKKNLRNAENVNEYSVGSYGLTIPTTYRIEVRAEKQQNPNEKSELSVVYAY